MNRLRNSFLIKSRCFIKMNNVVDNHSSVRPIKQMKNLIMSLYSNFVIHILINATATVLNSFKDERFHDKLKLKASDEVIPLNMNLRVPH